MVFPPLESRGKTQHLFRLSTTKYYQSKYSGLFTKNQSFIHIFFKPSRLCPPRKTGTFHRETWQDPLSGQPSLHPPFLLIWDDRAVNGFLSLTILFSDVPSVGKLTFCGKRGKLKVKLMSVTPPAHGCKQPSKQEVCDDIFHLSGIAALRH